MNIDLIDFSVYSNTEDRHSDEIIVDALCQLGCETRIINISRKVENKDWAENIWMRYDARTMDDLRFVIGFTADLEQKEHNVFPPSQAIENSEDKWLTYLVLAKANIPTVPTFPVSEIGNCGEIALIKPRPGWGGQGQKLIRNISSFKSFRNFPESKYICQPFISHNRTITVIAAAGVPLITIEKKLGIKDHRTNENFGGTAKVCQAGSEFDNMAVAALKAVGLTAGSVDLIENKGRIEVLEVNSAPGLFYKDEEIRNFNFAVPLAKSIVKCYI